MKDNEFFMLLIKLRNEYFFAGWSHYLKAINKELVSPEKYEKWQLNLLNAMCNAPELASIRKKLFKNIIKNTSISNVINENFNTKKNKIPQNIRNEFKLDKILEEFSKRFSKKGENDLSFEAIIAVLTTYYIILIDKKIFWFHKIVPKNISKKLIDTSLLTSDELEKAKMFFTVLIYASKYEITNYNKTVEIHSNPNRYLRILGYLYRGFIYYIKGELNLSINDLFKAEQQILRMKNTFHYSNEYFVKSENMKELRDYQVKKIREHIQHYSFLQIYYIFCNIGLGNSFQAKGLSDKAFDHYCEAMRELKVMKLPSRGYSREAKWRSSYLLVIEAEMQKAKLFLEKGLIRHATIWFFISLVSILKLVSEFVSILNEKTNDKTKIKISIYNKKSTKIIEKINLIINYLSEDIKHNFKIEKSVLIEIVNSVTPCDIYALLDFKDIKTYTNIKNDRCQIINYFTSEIFSMLGFIFFTLKLDYVDTKCQKRGCKYRASFKSVKRSNTGSVSHWLFFANILCPENNTVRYHNLLFDLRHVSESLYSKNFINKFNINTIEDDFVISVLKKMENIATTEKNPLERNLLISLLLNPENFITLPSKMFLNLLPSKSAEKSDFFLVLRRWSSFSPRIPARVPKPTGGGYFFSWQSQGIVVDPGYDFLENLYQEGYSLKDIDAIFITHYHADHTNDFQPILDLLYEMNRLNQKIKKEKDFHGVFVYLNKGAYSAFSTLLNSMELIADKREKIIKGIRCLEADSFMIAEELNMIVETVNAPHAEMIGEHCVGLIFNLMDPEKFWDKNTRLCKGMEFKLEICPPEFKIGITGDTRYYETDISIKDESYSKANFKVCNKGHRTKMNDNPCEICNSKNTKPYYYHSISNRYKKCDLLVTHLGNLQFKELYNMINELKFSDDEINEIEKAFNMNKKSEEEKYRLFLYSLGCKLVSNIPYIDLLYKEKNFIKALNGGEDPIVTNLLGHFKSDMEDLHRAKKRLFSTNHLGLQGVKRLFEVLCESVKNEEGKFNKLMIISEFREEMRNYRDKIAFHLNEMALNKYGEKRAGCLTGDIGLKIFLQKENNRPKFKIRCLPCSKNNDRPEEKAIYPYENITEVCIKSEDHSIHHYCELHDSLTPEGEKIKNPGDRRNYKKYFIEKTH